MFNFRGRRGVSDVEYRPIVCKEGCSSDFPFFVYEDFLK